MFITYLITLLSINFLFIYASTQKKPNIMTALPRPHDQLPVLTTDGQSCRIHNTSSFL